MQKLILYFFLLFFTSQSIHAVLIKNYDLNTLPEKELASLISDLVIARFMFFSESEPIKTEGACKIALNYNYLISKSFHLNSKEDIHDFKRELLICYQSKVAESANKFVLYLKLKLRPKRCSCRSLKKALKEYNRSLFSLAFYLYGLEYLSEKFKEADFSYPIKYPSEVSMQSEVNEDLNVYYRDLRDPKKMEKFIEGFRLTSVANYFVFDKGVITKMFIEIHLLDKISSGYRNSYLAKLTKYLNSKNNERNRELYKKCLISLIHHSVIKTKILITLALLSSDLTNYGLYEKILRKHFYRFRNGAIYMGN
ncbi:hypothetical protein FG379_001469 [Cryptosporidium bovis]|uniref:uncharacterized protein n=1 Tax=Cryptosporidium bovis TaxID=310047 RepID=UPI00351A7646|nr:hypothetical protein FG379_001469 [Cryptosporidium bovis]